MRFRDQPLTSTPLHQCLGRPLPEPPGASPPWPAICGPSLSCQTAAADRASTRPLLRRASHRPLRASASQAPASPLPRSTGLGRPRYAKVSGSSRSGPVTWPQATPRRSPGLRGDPPAASIAPGTHLLDAPFSCPEQSQQGGGYFQAYGAQHPALSKQPANAPSSPILGARPTGSLRSALIL
ncbi:hypothetical protein NDU88_005611 [Pleurodeles waltl]|uniref:Uncharacterized protein n=1 Tax=Pleurodeles waltl TaxID=8319 RepID=A0AAV7TVY3_PLEWA|nr:hypothetical protein NDU88_005611 [Pleurodeles waltl]